MKEFYVYIILNPLNQGPYTYFDYTFEAEPFYVGKGKGNRKYSHLKEARGLLKITNFEKVELIKSILEHNQQPIILTIEEDLTETDAFFLERTLIEIIGLNAKNAGPLINIQPGNRNIPEAVQTLYKTLLSEVTHEYFRQKIFR